MQALQVVSSPKTKDAEELTSYFCYCCGMRRLPWMTPAFSKLLREFEADLLHEVIDRTARAPRPSWAYLSAILNNCRSVGAYDLFSMETKTSRKQREWQEELPY